MMAATLSLADARRKAERCFALARSTTFAGERESAIARGIAIAGRANLKIDTFDIPGRERAAASQSSARVQVYAYSGPNYDEAAKILSAAMAAAQQAHSIRRAQQLARWPDLEKLVNHLFSHGIVVYDMGGAPDDDEPRWYLPNRTLAKRLDDWGLRDIADELAR